jgi:hypothetical protein
MQSVPITTIKDEFESRSCQGVLGSTLCDKSLSVTCEGSVVFYIYIIQCSVNCDDYASACTPVSSYNKTDCHDITEILLKVEINIINQTISSILKTNYLTKELSVLTLY